ncbi:NAD(P)/FAD-dependent oxidoreductase [Desulfoplanes formicivorans]|uniref:Thioredoxin reductase n=1 Tax=Desulfoplanes formicivorans TaxID=1592317 RepID=A0A194ALK7_9BACT|nr:NAD(P)/FAD-dependent oxidoreductase [Desulfoplanes formicivorans]GAU09544.1 thioredoxin reductase [Desulfoplanes formicivorans]
MNHVQILIVGQGPAGLSAAIYTARAGLSTQILGCAPKIAGDYDIDNYFGFPEPITGSELIERGKAQAKRFGVDMRCERVLGIHPTDKGTFEVKTEKGTITADAIILATGVARVKSMIQNASDYEGKGISYCVSCDAFFYRNKKVMVVGEGIFAANQALELKEYTPHVSICTQGRALTMTPAFLQRLEKADIPILDKTVTKALGENGLEAVLYDDGTTEPMDGIFVARGEASSLDFAYSLGLLRKGVFIEADNEQKTNVPGVFAAGDCVGNFLQISVAVGEGAKAGRSAIKYLKGFNNNGE